MTRTRTVRTSRLPLGEGFCKSALCVLGLLLVIALAGIGSAPTPAWAAGGLTVSGGTLSTDYDYAGGILTVKTGTPLTISGTTTTDRIVVDGPDARITFNGVHIDVSAMNNVPALYVKSGSLELTIADGSANTLKSGEDKAGLQNDNNRLVIKGGAAGTGTLEAVGGKNGAGIGGGFHDDGSFITIQGGVITAQGGKNATGIGGGASGNGTDVTIEGGRVYATGNGASGIGGGGNDGGGAPASGENNRIDGNAWVEASSIPEGMTYTKGVAFVGDTGTVYGTVALPFDAEIASGKTLTAPIGSSLSLDAGTRLANNGTLVIDGGALAGPGLLEGPGRYLKYDVTPAMIKVPTDLKYDGTDQTAAATGGTDLVDPATPVTETILDRTFTVTYGLKELWELSLPSGMAVKDARDDYEVVCTHKDDPARHASATFAVAKASASIVADDKQKGAGEDDPELTAVVSGAVPGDALAYSLAREPGEDAGEYAIRVTVGDAPVNANYDIVATDAVLTVQKAASDPQGAAAGTDSTPKPLSGGGLPPTGDGSLAAPVALAAVGALALLAMASLFQRRGNNTRER